MVLRHESALWYLLGIDIGVMERIEHRPQHAAFEFKRRKHRLLLRRRIGVALDVVEREIDVPLGLRPSMRSPMMTGENISVSDEAMASSRVFSRTKRTYASTANRVPGSRPRSDVT
jgi:hypothetical protein